MPTIDVTKQYQVSPGPVIRESNAFVFCAAVNGSRVIPILRYDINTATWTRLDTNAVISPVPAALTTLVSATTSQQQTAIDNVLANTTVQAAIAGLL